MQDMHHHRIIAAAVTVVIAFFMVLTAVLIGIIIFCYIRAKRKNGQGTSKSDATDPNPVHYSNQGIYTATVITTESQQ